MRFVKNIAIGFLMLLLLTGCDAEDSSKQKEADQQPPNKAEQQLAEKNGEVKPLEEAEVIQLIIAAKDINWYVASGGEVSDPETFEYQGINYRYLDETLATREKLEQYLQQVFTENAAKALLEELGIIEYQGRMAQPDSGGGSILQWEKAKASLLKEDATSKDFEIKVPYGEEDDSIDYDVFTVVLKYIPEKGWRIDTPLLAL